ncbi:MAG: (deoxy)nucleoside triphosphate pyrophosphohydrolase [Erysipelotrichaceae bacterium]|nr:(deoxy)nucleoside triphosphate pyrophosphohydrolase [Erysipelotrichaceae bacterium]
MKTVKVAAAVIKDAEKILIAQRLKGEFKGKWEFPGGKLEENEDSVSALKREIKEEMEADIKIDQYLCTIEHDYDSFHLSMDVYICHFLNQNIKLHDHMAFRWIKPDEKISTMYQPILKL